MTNRLEELLESVRHYKMSEGEKEEQRRSFAFGNIKIENDLVTREMLDEEAEKLSRKG